LGDRSGAAITLHQLAMLHQDQGEYPQAHTLYQQSLAIAEELGDRSGAAITLHQLGLLCEKEGQLQQAVNHLARAHALFDAFGAPECEQSARDLARLQEQIGEPSFNNNESFLGRINIGFSGLSDKANELIGKGKWIAALDVIRQLIEESNNAGDFGVLAKALHKKGDVNLLLRRLGTARIAYRDAVRIFKDLGDKENEAESLGSLGKVFFAFGEQEEAVKCLENSAIIYDQLSNEKKKSEVLEILELLRSYIIE